MNTINVFSTGGDFMIKYLRNPKTNKCYLSVTKEGLPLKIQRTIYTEVFYCMGMIGLAKATNNDEYKVVPQGPISQYVLQTQIHHHISGRGDEYAEANPPLG